MLNKVMLIGRLSKDVELRQTPAGKYVANTSIATSRKTKKADGTYEEKTEFHNLVIWNGSENFAKYLSKGSKVYVEGELINEMYEKDGVKHYPTKVNVSNFLFLDNKSDSSGDKEQFVKDGVNIKVEPREEEMETQNIPF